MLVTGEALKSAAIRSSQYKLLSVRICVATYLASGLSAQLRRWRETPVDL